MIKYKKYGVVFITVRLKSQRLFTYDIASREVAYWILSSQRDGAEHDEDQDKVGEDLMVDQLMAEYAKATAESEKQGWERGTEAEKVQ